MPVFSQSLVRRYGVAALSVAVAVTVRLLLDPVLGDAGPFATVYFSVLVAGRYGGFGPALLAALLGAVASTWWILHPRGSFVLAGFENQSGLTLYLAVSLGIAYLGGAMRAAQERWRTTATEALRQREELRTTLSSIGDAVIVTDTQGLVTSMNPVAEQLTGWKTEEAIGRSLDDVFVIVNEQTRRPVESPVTRVLQEGTVVGLANHTSLIARNGTDRPIDDSAAPIRDEQGRLVGVVLVFRDVSDRRYAEIAHRRLSAIVESSDDAIVSKDLDGVITSWNAGAERVYGYSAEEVIGKPFSILVPPDRSAEVKDSTRRLQQGERLDHFETVRQRKDGTRIDVSVSYSPIKDADGLVIGTAVITRDVTARKRAEDDAHFLANVSASLAALVDRESTLQKVARLAVPHFCDWCAIDVLDENQTLRRVAVTHVDPSKVELAHEMYRRFPPDPQAPQGVWNILRTGRSELVAEISDELLTASVRDPELLQILRTLGLRSYMGVPLEVRGKVLGVITFIAAESGRRYDAHDLATAEDLAHRAAIAIENARLYQEVRDADRKKDEFLSLLAHELRNPLAPIRNALEILKLAGPHEEAIEQARAMAERQVHALTRMVDDLLDVSRIMRGKIELRRARIDLATVVARAVETARPVIDAERHELTVSVAEEPICIDADLVRLSQVVANLLNNAAKYTDRGGRIWLTAGREGDAAVIRVRDTGIGIPAEKLRSIFDMFMQVEASGKRSQGGLGIGLTVVRNLLQLHGGTVEAHSAGPGQGSEFVVRLPLTEPQLDNPTQNRSSNKETPCVSRRILVVDDNADAADSLALLLRLQGHAVRVAHNGSGGLKLAESEPPDVAFLDIGMPDMSGHELARRLRTNPALRQTMLVAMTGWGQEEDRRKTRESGFDHHLVKPVEMDVLQELLARSSVPRRGT